jgi:hypothetical protein
MNSELTMNEASAEVHRLPDLDNWEFYEITGAPDGPALGTIALRHYPDFSQAEYGYWSPEAESDENPTGTGVVGAAAWSDDARCSAITEILVQRSAVDQVEMPRLQFFFGVQGSETQDEN